MRTTSLKTAKNDMKSLVQDAQELFLEATSVTADKAEELRNKGLYLLESALSKAQDVQAITLETGKEIAVSTNEYVQENPWKAIAISASLGLLVGAIIARK